MEKICYNLWILTEVNVLFATSILQWLRYHIQYGSSQGELRENWTMVHLWRTPLDVSLENLLMKDEMFKTKKCKNIEISFSAETQLNWGCSGLTVKPRISPSPRFSPLSFGLSFSRPILKAKGELLGAKLGYNAQCSYEGVANLLNLKGQKEKKILKDRSFDSSSWRDFQESILPLFYNSKDFF